MKRETVFYGLLILGSLLAYYAWKEHTLSVKKSSEKSTTPLSQTSGVFVDDVPVNPSIFDIQEGGKSSLFENIKNSASQITEPFISTQKQNQLNGQGELLQS